MKIAASRPASSAAGIRIRLLIVEDHPLLLRGLESFFESEAADIALVGKATSADEGCAAAQRLDPDVVLLDLDLGGLIELPVISRLVKNGRPRVLVYTRIRDPAVHREAIMLGARGVIDKSNESQVLLKAIRRVMAGEVWLDRVGIGEVVSTLMRSAELVGTAPAPDPRVARLTRRETEIIIAMHANRGHPAKSVAASLKITEHTLRNHLTTVYQKFGISSRVELSALAEKFGLVRTLPH